jgi:hypothetical protein
MHVLVKGTAPPMPAVWTIAEQQFQMLVVMHSVQVAWVTARNSCLAALTRKDLCAAAVSVPGLQHLLGQPGCHSSLGRVHPQGRTPVWVSQ